MMDLSYDFHIHTCLSPCADNDMTPQNIVGMSCLKSLDAIAITDHNSCKNCGSTIEASKDTNLLVIPGMELTTSEEVHVLCLFYALQSAMAFDEYVCCHLPPIPNKEHIFGEQLLCNALDEVTGKIPTLLINATDISIEHLYELVTGYDGIIIPAHLDRSSSSIISNLGFIPPNSRFTCAELHDLTDPHAIRASNPYLNHCHILCSSDAHTLGDISEPTHALSVPNRSIKSILDTLGKKVESPLL